MVFQIEAQFQQFIHSKFRENTVRVLYIPHVEERSKKIFLVVNKYGKVGLYEPEKFRMLHTYLLDLSAPMKVDMSYGLEQIAKKAVAPPKCQRTHLVVDAIYAPDVHSIIFATTKNILQWYDLGEIETLSYGLEIFPRQKFMKLKSGQSPVILRNKGHVETHRVFGLPSSAPFYCMEYIQSSRAKISNADHSIEISGKSQSKLIIGDQEGFITIITIENPSKLFRKSKTRGILHKIKSEDLERLGFLTKYRAHNDMVKEIKFVHHRQLIISCSRDKKFSLFIKDYTDITEPYIISLPKGVNTFAHSDPLKLIATGSEDSIVRLFNQFVMKMPQMELLGHKSPVVALEFLQVPFSENPILISYSVDVEIRAWDPVEFTCLQSMHVSFPIRSSIMTKTPEFGKKPLIIHQPHYETMNEPEVPLSKIQESIAESKEMQPTPARHESPTKTTPSPSSLLQRGQDGFIIVLYCNSYAKLDIEKNTTHWPFDFDDFIAEFEEVSTVYENKLRDKQRAYAESKYCSKDPNVLKLSAEEISGIESKLDSYVHEILKIKRHADQQLGSQVYDPNKKSLAGEGTRRFLELQNTSKQAELFKREGISTSFKSIPLYDIEPVEFSSAKAEGISLPVTNHMQESGIKKVTSISDLLTPLTRKCFFIDKMKEMEMDAVITARTAEEMSELSASVKTELKLERTGKTLPLEFTSQIEEDSFESEESCKKFYRKD